jgi:hypothetical protein
MKMDHAEAAERLELAALEPRSLDRLLAGDSPEAADLAAHIAGCADCTAELADLRASTSLIHGAVRTLPPGDLRERTLAYVASAGRPRPDLTPAAAVEARDRPVRARALAWTSVAAAAVVVAVVATAFFVGSGADSEIAEANRSIAGLGKLAGWTARLSGDPDAERVELRSTSGGQATATVLFAGDTGELVMVATGLQEPSPASEYRCWVELAGVREPIGQLYFTGDLGYWVGNVDLLMHAETAAFGISLVDADSQGAGGDAVLLSKSN